MKNDRLKVIHSSKPITTPKFRNSNELCKALDAINKNLSRDTYKTQVYASLGETITNEHSELSTTISSVQDTMRILDDKLLLCTKLDPVMRLKSDNKLYLPAIAKFKLLKKKTKSLLNKQIASLKEIYDKEAPADYTLEVSKIENYLYKSLKLPKDSIVTTSVIDVAKSTSGQSALRYTTYIRVTNLPTYTGFTYDNMYFVLTALRIETKLRFFMTAIPTFRIPGRFTHGIPYSGKSTLKKLLISEEIIKDTTQVVVVKPKDAWLPALPSSPQDTQDKKHEEQPDKSSKPHNKSDDSNDRSDDVSWIPPIPQ